MSLFIHNNDVNYFSTFLQQLVLEWPCAVKILDKKNGKDIVTVTLAQPTTPRDSSTTLAWLQQQINRMEIRGEKGDAKKKLSMFGLRPFISPFWYLEWFAPWFFHR